MSRNVIGYGCISAAVLKKDRENAIENSKVKEELDALHDRIHGLFLPEDAIEIDVLTGNRRNRKKLKEIIEELTSDPSTMFLRPRGTIVIPSILDLGNTADEIIENFNRIVPLNIGLLVADEEKYSTVTYGFEYYPDIDVRIPRILDEIKNDIKGSVSRRGRRKSDAEVTPEFKEIYWYYENYFIPEPLAYENNKTGKYSNPDLVFKPKRYGTVPANFKDLIHYHIEIGMPLQDACNATGCPTMTEITFQRYLIKEEGKKKEMAKATHRYKNDELSASLELHEENA